MQAIVFFGNDLSQAEFNNDDIRQRVLSEGLELVKQVPGVSVLSELGIACAAGVSGTNEDLLELEETLVQLGRGCLEIDNPRNPPLRAAL